MKNYTNSIPRDDHTTKTINYIISIILYYIIINATNESMLILPKDDFTRNCKHVNHASTNFLHMFERLYDNFLCKHCDMYFFIQPHVIV